MKHYKFKLIDILITFSMSSFKSPELQVCGKIVKVFEPTSNESSSSSFYVKVTFLEGEEWRIIEGKRKFETFESQTEDSVAYLDHPFSLHYITTSTRGWPRILVQAWKIDEDGRHNIYGYGTVSVPVATGQYNLQIPCWRPVGSWYDRFIGANSQLQYPSISVSSLNRYGLRTFSGCTVQTEVKVIGRNFQLHGLVRS